MKVNEGEVLDDTRGCCCISTLLLFAESKLLHDGVADHVVTQLFLVNYERDVLGVLCQEDKDSLFRVCLVPEFLCSTHVQVAERVQRLV